MDWRAKVELFEQIRREYEHGAGTIRAVARDMDLTAIHVYGGRAYGAACRSRG